MIVFFIVLHLIILHGFLCVSDLPTPRARKSWDFNDVYGEYSTHDESIYQDLGLLQRSLTPSEVFLSLEIFLNYDLN